MKPKTFKRLAAAVLAVAMVGTAHPAEVAGISLFSGSFLTASAEEQSVTIATNTAQNSYTQDGVTIEVDAPQNGYGFLVTTEHQATISAPTGYVITKAELTVSYYPNNADKIVAINYNSVKCNVTKTGISETGNNSVVATVNDVYDEMLFLDMNGENDMVNISSVTVYYEPKSNNVTGVLLNKAEDTLGVGSTEKLKARVIQENADHKNVVWSSDNESVATVDQEGIVTAVSPGTATITVTATNGTNSTTADDKTAVCTITVLEPITYLDWDAESKTTVEKKDDDACKFYNVITSVDGDLDLTDGWYVVKDNVTINGLVRIKGDVHLILCDNAKLTVNNTASSNPDNYLERPFAIEVKEEMSLTVYGQSEGDSVGELYSECYSTKNSGYDTYTTGNAISLRENSSITVNSGRVTTKAGSFGISTYGTLTINGGDVTFYGASNGIFLGKSTNNYQVGNMTINGGRTTAYSDNLYPALYNNADSGENVTFADNMFFTGKDNRNANEEVLRITNPFRGIYYWVRIEPIADVTEITLDKTETALAVGSTETLEATIDPINSDCTVTWKSSNEAVATVDEKGKITAVSRGTAIITATATNGTDNTDDDKEATCTVTVTADNDHTVISSANITLGGELGLNFYLTIPDETAAGLKAVMNGPEGKKEAELTKSGDHYRVSYPVKAIHADKSVTLTLIDSEGETVDLYNTDGERLTDNEFTYGIYDYVNTAMGLDEEYVSSDQREQIKAMYTYAAYSVKWKYDTALPTDYVNDLPNITADSLESYKLTASGTENVDLQGASLLLDSNTAFKLYFKCDDTIPEITLNGNEITPVKSGDMYYISVNNIGAKHLKDKFTVVFGGEYTVEFTALSYAYGVLSSTNESIKNDTKLNDIVKAICAYSDEFSASATN